MRLFMTEKAILARAIAAALPKPFQYHKGFIEAANGDRLIWCAGIFLSLAPPEMYTINYKKWRLADLPIISDPCQWVIKPETQSQFELIKDLVQQADVIIHAGNPNSEGQLWIDTILSYLKVEQPIKRLLIHDLNKESIKKALAQLQDNSEFHCLSQSALVRLELDYLYEMNLTRLYRLINQEKVRKQGLSVGRLQTPVLGLVVKRDHDIEQFRSRIYFDLSICFSFGDSRAIGFTWLSNKTMHHEIMENQDNEGRVISRESVENLAHKLNNVSAVVTDVEENEKRQSPPLPYSLSMLQIEAAYRYGLSGDAVLNACQSLYEQHRVITYPRSDCAYLPEVHHTMASKILQVIDENQIIASSHWMKAINCIKKSKAWDDKKVDIHHGIIPTKMEKDLNELKPAEKQVYRLICQRYIMQFCDDFVYHETVIHVKACDEHFKSNIKQIKALGWRQISLSDHKGKVSGTEDKLSSNNKVGDISEGRAFKKGQHLDCSKVDVIDKKTSAPLRFTDASLLSAMVGIARFVDDEKIKKCLSDTDGLGTAATRASIVETLFKRGFLKRNKKQIISTSLGRQLIASLPVCMTQPDLTVECEKALEAIKIGQLEADEIRERFKRWLVKLVGEREGEMLSVRW